jgi:hypothetical protein
MSLAQILMAIPVAIVLVSIGLLLIIARNPMERP